MLTLWSINRNLPSPITALLLACFAFSKPDLILTGGLLAIFLIVWQRESWPRKGLRAAFLAAAFAALLIPALIFDEGEPYNRSLVSLIQHYAVLVSRHQMIPDAPEPWSNSYAYSVPVFDHPPSLRALITNNPRAYYDFVFLSLGQSLYNVVISGLVLIVPGWWYCWRRLRDRRFKIATVILLLGLLPILFLSFTHVRYLARFYPLLLFGIYSYSAQSDPSSNWQHRLLTFYLIVVLILQIILLEPVFQAGHWHPD